MQATNWVFTINNPTLSDLRSIAQAWETKRLKLLIASLEIGEEGTPHYQGYLEATRSLRRNVLSALLPRAFLERRKGSRKQAIQYVIKDVCLEDSATLNQTPMISTTQSLMNSLLTPPLICFGYEDPYQELKTISTQSCRKPRKMILQEMKQMIENNNDNKALADFDFPTFIQCYRGLNYYRLIISQPRNHATQVLVLQGPTGTGKSKYAMDNYPKAYWKQRSNWWDGYEDHEVVILDEFYGWLPFDLLLRLCDRYPLHVETKGGNVNFVAKKIIITTNQVPERWYKNVYFQSFIRRVTEWHIFPTWGEHEIYQIYENALPRMINNY